MEEASPTAADSRAWARAKQERMDVERRAKEEHWESITNAYQRRREEEMRKWEREMRKREMGGGFGRGMPGRSGGASRATASAGPYQALGLQPGATRDEVKQAFRKLALEVHPDHNEDPKAPERFAELRAAFEVLMDALPKAPKRGG